MIKDKNKQFSEMQETVSVRSEMQGLMTEVGNTLQSEIRGYRELQGNNIAAEVAISQFLPFSATLSFSHNFNIFRDFLEIL